MKLRLATGDPAGALFDLSCLIGLEPENAEHFYQRSLLRAQLGDLRGAAGDMDEVTRLDPSFERRVASRHPRANRDDKRPSSDTAQAAARSSSGDTTP